MQHYLEVILGSEQLSDELRHPKSSFYLATHQDLPAGYLKINTGDAQTELQNENTLEIERIYVLKQFQGLNIGARLLQKAIDIGKTSQVNFIWLGVWEKNPKAISFYEHMGFKTFGAHTFRLGAEDQIDILMRIDLK